MVTCDIWNFNVLIPKVPICTAAQAAYNFGFCLGYVVVRHHSTFQPCQNVLAVGKFATFSQFLAAYSTLDFTKSPLASKGTWCLQSTSPAMLPAATKHFGRADFQNSKYNLSIF